MSPKHQKIRLQKYWEQRAPLAHRFEQRYSKKAVRRLASSFYPGLALQKQQGEAMKWSRFLLGKFWHHLRPGYRQPWGLQKQQRQDPPEWAPPLEEEDEKPKIGGPTKGINHKVLANKQQSTKRRRVRKSTWISYKAQTLGKG
jgi:hypothetical protein